MTTSANLAYIMYTSGTTGKPKGSAIPHRAVVRLVKTANYLQMGPDQVFLQIATLSFDASTLEIWGPLLNGGRLVVFPSHQPTLQELGSFLRKNQITTLWLTAGLFHQMVDECLQDLKEVRQILAGGDVLSPTHVRKMLSALPQGSVLVNGYGPTENTTFTCCYPMISTQQIGASVPIGRPIPNTYIYVLDEDQRLSPLGVAGELYIGGDGLAREYWNQPALTAERFIPDPFRQESGARLYKTGDLVRILPDGNLEFIGRIDNQVKIRGFRIELAEIETVLGKNPIVREAAVVVRSDPVGEKRLVTYLVVTDLIHSQPEIISTIRDYLKQKLPDYMIPAAFVLLEQLPLTPNGKVDRKALPEPTFLSSPTEHNIAPQTPAEKTLARLWSEILGIKDISIHDNFFDLGGHSLLATRLFVRIQDTFGLELPLRLLFEAPTIFELAQRIENQVWATEQNTLLKETRDANDEEMTV